MRKLLMTMMLMPLMTLADTWTDPETCITWTYTVVGLDVASVGSPYSVSPAISTSTTGGITIPSALGGCSVISIEHYAFRDCSKLTSVTIPSSVTNIGNSAFYGCSGLTSVAIPEGVTSIGERAFVGCDALTSVTIPSSVTAIGNWAFDGCSGLKSVTISEGVTSIGEAAFVGCDALTSVTIPSSVRDIGEDAFGGCGGLTSISVNLNNTAYLSEDGILYDKLKTKLIQCPGGKMGDVTIPSSVTSIGNCAFYGCSGLKLVTIPSSVTSIGNRAFYGCSGLKSVTIPPSVTSIGEDAFLACSGLESATIPSSVTSIGEGAFHGCSGLADADGFVIVRERLYDYCGTATSVTIPSSVTNIGDYAFADCSDLTSVTIPSSVMSIGDWAFGWCSGLKSVTISEGVISIGYGAFYECSGLESVTIPSSVTNIGEDAFCCCSGLKSVTISEGVTSIGDWAFEDCSGLESVTIPSSVRNIGEGAFDCCIGLKLVLISEGVTAIGVCEFDGCSGLESVTIPSSVTSIGDQAFWGCSGLKSVTIPSSVMCVGDSVFYGCENLKTVYVDAGDECRVRGLLEQSGFDVSGVQFLLKGGESERPEEPVPEPEPEPVLGPAPDPVLKLFAEIPAIAGNAPYAAAAVVYDGMLMQDDVVKGTIQVKVAKMKNGEAKVTATVQMAGQSKKISFKGGVADATGKVTDMTDKNGNKLAVTVGVNGLGGEFRRSRSDTPYRIDGARNVFSGKSAADKAAASAAVRLYQGVYNVAFDGGTLSVSVDKKGKAKIAGTVEGNKVSATSQLVVGKDAAVVPVVITKKVNLSFCLWVMADGTVEARGVEGSIADRPGTLKAGAKFGVDGAAGVRALPGLYGEYLPNGINVAASGTKWVVAGGAKAGKVAFVKDGNTVDESKLGTNPSGLKLTYKQKDGTFKGSFKAYNLESNGKIKAYTANVTGVMIGTKGYGTATIKKPFVSFSIAIE